MKPPLVARLAGAVCPACGTGLDPVALSRTRATNGVGGDGPVRCPGCGAGVRLGQTPRDRWRAGLMVLPVALVWGLALATVLSMLAAATGLFAGAGGRLNGAGIAVVILAWAPVVWLAHLRFTPKVVKA